MYNLFGKSLHGIIFHQVFSKIDREDKKSKIHFCYKWVEVEVINQSKSFMYKLQSAISDKSNLENVDYVYLRIDYSFLVHH